MHFVLNESEEANKRELDNGELGVERKLYYRELIARFGHHLALQWNLCEEYNLGLDLGPDRMRAFAHYVRAVDPYDHPITVHPADDPLEALAFMFGDPSFDVTSVQLNQRRIDLVTEAVREATAKAGRPLPACMDEFTIDKGTNKSYIPVDDPELYRKQKLWPTYLSGGSIEFILEGLLENDNLKRPQCEALWNSVWHARNSSKGCHSGRCNPMTAYRGAGPRSRWASAMAGPPTWGRRCSLSAAGSTRSISPRRIPRASSTCRARQGFTQSSGTTRVPEYSRETSRVRVAADGFRSGSRPGIRKTTGSCSSTVRTDPRRRGRSTFGSSRGRRDTWRCSLFASVQMARQPSE